VPFAKAYSGLANDEIAEVDSFVRGNTLQRFGPVRSVTPALVFEIAFENIQISKRHKSGVAVRFPRILRWRRDKSAQDADRLTTLKSLIR
jgi:DNA ligase-1